MKSIKLLLISISVVFLYSCERPYQPTVNDWPQFKNDNYRSGKSAVAIFDKSFGEKWAYNARLSPAPAWYGPAKEDAYALSGPLPSMRDYDLAYSPVIVNNKMYFGSSSDDAVHCINTETGKEEWIFTTNGPVRIAPTYWNGNLYFGSDDGFVYCIDAKKGDIKWKFSPSDSEQRLLNNGRLISFWPVRTGVLIENGKAYFGASLIPWKKSYLCSIDAKSGKVKGNGTYVKELENMTFEGSMASSGDRLIQPQGRISPVFIDKKTGTPEGQLSGAGGCFVLVTPDKHIVNTQTSRHLGIWETIPGEKKPEYMSFTGGKEMVVSGDTSYVLSDNSISAYNRKTKEIIWSNKNYFGHRIVLAKNTLFVGATDTVYAVSVANGNPLWKGRVEGTVYAMAVGDSSLFASTGEGKIYCFSRNGFQKNREQKESSDTNFVNADSVKIIKHPLNLTTGPFTKAITTTTISLYFTTPKKEKCTVYWHSNGNIIQKVFAEKRETRNHNFNIPVRKDFIYHYRIECNGKSTPEFEYDNFFNFTKYNVNVPTEWIKDTPTSRFLKETIKQAGKTNGVCLIVGLQNEQVAVELAKNTRFDVIVFDKSAKKIESFRKKLQKAGVYGRRISAYKTADLNNLPVQSNLADLVICSVNGIAVDEAIRITAPLGKTFYLTGKEKKKLEKQFSQLTENSNYDWDVDKETIKAGDNFAVVLTKKAPDSNGVWTHQYGSGSNASFGGEDLWGNTSSEDFEIQWMGRPGPRFQTDRTGRKPAPLAINGKMFVQGNQRVVAINAFNGTVLWSKDIPGMMRMNVNHDCSNWAADNRFIYIVVKDKLLELDQNSGEIIKEISVSDRDRKSSDWGYIGTGNGLVYVSESPKNSSFTDYYGQYGWYDATRGPATEKVMSSKLFAFKPQSDKVVWKYDSGKSKVINPTILSYDGKIFFVESASAKLSKKNRGDLNIFKKIYLVSLNAKDGSLIWRKKIENKPGITAYYMAAGANRIVIESSVNFKYYLYGYNAGNGEPVWTAEQNWYSNNHGGHLMIPAISGERLMVKPALYNVVTGERLSYSVPKAGHGCAAYALSENSVFYRGGSVTQFSFDTRKFSKWERLRPDCWISTVPALGMVLSPEGGGGCSCGNWFETSMVMAPKSRAPILLKYRGDSKFIDTLTVTVEIKKGVRGDLFYTFDGSEPDKNSNRYTHPVKIYKNTQLRVAIFTEKDGKERKFEKRKYFERLHPAPTIVPEYLLSGGKRKIAITKNGNTGVIHYTVDGSVPDAKSPVYGEKIIIDKKTAIKTITIWEEDFGTFKSKIASTIVDVPEALPAIEKTVEPGLKMAYYEGEWNKLPDFGKEKILNEKVVEMINLEYANEFYNYGMVFSGYIKVDNDGIYKFFTRSDDGSALYIDGKKVVDNDGHHAPVEKSGEIVLKKGLHKIRVEYFQSGEGKALGVAWETPLIKKTMIPDNVLWH